MSRNISRLCLLAFLLSTLSACDRQKAIDTPPPAAADLSESTSQSVLSTSPTAEVSSRRIMLADDEPGTWMTHGRTYSEQRYSPLTEINQRNVSKLGLA